MNKEDTGLFKHCQMQLIYQTGCIDETTTLFPKTLPILILANSTVINYQTKSNF